MSRRCNAGALAAFACALSAITASAAPPLEEVVEQTYPVSAETTLSLKNIDGTIYVYGWDKDEIKITARKKAYSRERLAMLRPEITVEGDRFTVTTTFPPKPEGLSLADRSGTVDYVLVVPQTSSLEHAEVERGEIVLEGLRGASANARLKTGRMVVRNCFSTSLEVAVQEGMLDLYYDWWEPLQFLVRGEIARGHIRATFPSYSGLQVDAATEDGKITNKFAEQEIGGAGRVLRTTIGDGKSGEIILRAKSGNITLYKID
jgi:hypothetical protein